MANSRWLNHPGRVGVAAAALLAIARLLLPATAGAASISGSASLYRANGAAVGTVSGALSDDGTSMVWTVTVQGLRPNTAYAVADCLPAPLADSVSDCAGSFAGGTL